MTSPPMQWSPGANGDAIVNRRENRPVSATSSAEASLATLPSNTVGKALLSGSDNCSGQSLDPGKICQFGFNFLAAAPGTFASALIVTGSKGATASQQVTAEVDDQIATISYDGQSIVDGGYFLLPSMAPPSALTSAQSSVAFWARTAKR